MNRFELDTELRPCGDQPRAIAELVEGVREGTAQQCLLGVTGSGKTFAMAHVVAELNLPTLVLAPNKILAAQLYTEFKGLFPTNAVEYFVSYYDYYQPEAYVPTTDTYIAKDAKINDEIDRMRHSATRSLLSRNDVLIVASVSCIYGIGSVEAYFDMLVRAHRGERIDRDRVLRKLVEIQYERNDYDFHRGSFRVRGDVVEVFPAHENSRAIRLEWFGDELERIVEVDPLDGKVLGELEKVAIYPNSHYVTPPERMQRALESIREELDERVPELEAKGALLEAQRLYQRTRHDLEILGETGHCKGIENYSRHLTGRAPGVAPPTLIDYFPDEYMLFIDESHVAVPQVGGMFRGDRARKETLVEHGFRLPSALDNRPLTFDEFTERQSNVVYVSATPADYEIDRTDGVIVEMIVRPTGLLDPEVEVRPVATQVDDLLDEIRLREERGERVLVTTLTKRMAEDLTDYYRELGVEVAYLHSDIVTLERIRILRDLRRGDFDVLIGINLLREGLDIPEVSLVAILDADKEGFLRSERSLVQTFGRASRNVAGKVILYADTITGSMRRAMDETSRRRIVQAAYNEERGIIPQTIVKPIPLLGDEASDPNAPDPTLEALTAGEIGAQEVWDQIHVLREEMLAAADRQAYEEAADLRDRIRAMDAAVITSGVS